MKVRKKPVVVEAVRWTGENFEEIEEFMEAVIDCLEYIWAEAERNVITISTLEGKMEAHIGDWIIKGVKGEFYPCKPDIFEQIYEIVQEQKECSG